MTNTTKKVRGPYKKKRKPRVYIQEKLMEPGGPNPFTIHNDMEYRGNRSNNVAIDQLFEQCVKLEKLNRSQSVSIPLTVCQSQASAGNLILALRRAVSEHKSVSINNMRFVSRTIYGANKTYLGTRVWRMN